MQSNERFGLSCALTLPVYADGSVDLQRLIAQAHRCLDAGCSSLTVFGTTGEGAAVSLREREQILDALVSAGISARGRILGGVMSSAVGDAVEQARLLYDRDCRGVLIAPPFYFKNVTDDGLYRWFSQVFEQLGNAARDVFLYHIPAVTHVPISSRLIARLKAAYPNVVAGVKDSGGDWIYTEPLLRAHGDLILLIGDERHLAAGVRLGAQGAISGLANVCPQRLLELIETGHEDPAIGEMVDELVAFPVTPAVKALVAEDQSDPAWRNVRAPLVALTEAEATHLGQALRRLLPAADSAARL